MNRQKKQSNIVLIIMLLCSIYSKADNTHSAYNEVLIAQPSHRVYMDFSYNINTDYINQTTVGGATITIPSNSAQLNTNATTSGNAATIASKFRVHYASGQGIICNFAARFTTGVTNNNQIVGIGNTQDGFFFGYNGTSFGIMRRTNSVDTWVTQTSWNGDVMNGAGASGVTLNPTNGNQYKIQFQWLGFGAIKFYIEDPSDGSWILVHTIRYANANTTTSLLDPNLQLWANTVNTGTAGGAVTLRVFAMAASLEGKLGNIFDLRHAIANTVGTAVATAPTVQNILTIQNKTTYQSKTNQIQVYIDEMTLYNDATNRDMAFIVYLNPTVAGTPSFTDVSTNTSVVSYDTAGTTVTGGKILGTFFIRQGSSRVIDLTSYNFRLLPGDRLVIGAIKFIAGGGASVAFCGLSWRERF